MNQNTNTECSPEWSVQRQAPTKTLHSIGLRSLRMLLNGMIIMPLLIASARAQTAPDPQNLPYSQNFGTSSFNTLPPGVRAWNGIHGGNTNTLALAAASSPSGDANLTAATSVKQGGGCYGYATGGNARFYIQTSSNATNGVNQLAIAVNTTGWQSITLSYDLEIIVAQPRTIGVICQYRLGNSGSWTSLTPLSGPNPFSQPGGTTGPKGTVTIQLPPAAEDHPNVQIRWALWRGTQSGNSAGLAIDNIAVSGTDGTPVSDYYAAAEGLTGASLRNALQAISATNHTPIPHGENFNPLRDIHEDPNNSGNVITVYSGTSLGKFEVYFPGGDRDPDASWDREHLWPVSFGLNPGSAQGPSYGDLFNLRPAINSVNTLRGNLYFDNSTGSVTVPTLAPLCSYDNNSWEPRNSEKGDIARIMFYMATRYDGSDPGTLNLQLANTPSSPASVGRFANLSTLIEWHAQDPVSEEEERIHQAIVNYQGNRNPFVDRPDFVSLLWGDLLADKTTATVTEGGAGDSYTLTLTSEPFANVSVQITSSPTGQVLVSPSNVTFHSGNWNQPQVIDISAIDDDIHEETMTVNLTHAVSSTDLYHDSQTLPPVVVTVIDNDDPPVASADLPLAYGGPWSPLPTGFQGQNLGTPYGSSLGGDTDPGSARFDNSGASLTVSFDSSPEILSYHLRGNSGTTQPTAGTFHILESSNGQNFSLVREVINKSTADEGYSDALAPDTRFVRFLFVEKITGNIQLDKLAITAMPLLTPWEEWLDGFGLTGADADPAADPDGDGFANLVEYALGRSPVAADPQFTAPLTEILPGIIRITAVLRISDASLASSAETTTDLSDSNSWTEVNVTRIVAEDQTGVPSGFERTIFEIDNDGATTRFARLKFIR